MPRKPSAKRIAEAEQRFKKALTEFVVSKGARPSDFYNYQIDTPLSLLRISVYGTWVACRFDDPAVATKVCGCAKISGKWNHHFYDGTLDSLDPDAAIARFGHELDRVLAWNAAA